MPDVLRNDFSGGLVTARDRSDLRAGELQNATGITYKRKDRRAWQLKGRTVFGEVLASSSIKGLKLFKFDEGGTDLLVALAGTGLYSSPTPDKLTGSFSLEAGGKNVDTDSLHAVHMDNKWFATTGKDANSVFEAGGAVRNHGMVSPQQKPAVTAQDLTTSGIKRAGTEVETGWTDEANATDGDADSFAYAFLQGSGSAVITLSDWSADTNTDRRIDVKMFIAGAQYTLEDDYNAFDVQADAGFNVNVKLELSEDAGLNFETFYDSVFTAFSRNPFNVVKSINDGLGVIDTDQVQLRVTLTYNGGTTPCSLRLMDAPIITGSQTAPFDADPGVRYALAEYSETYGIRSAPGPPSDVVDFNGTGSNHNAAHVPLPASTRNSVTTHYIVYRTPNGGSVPKQLGEIAFVPIAEAAGIGYYVDDFSVWSATEQPLPIVPLKLVRSGSAELPFPRDSAPPVFDHIGKFRGQLVGIKGRKLYFAEPGLPDSVPEINFISDFEIEEHDVGVGTMQIGDTLWVGFEEAVVFLDGLPEVSDGKLIQPPKRVLSGFPGCPATYGFTTYEEQGTPRGAWISRYGIVATDGFRARYLTLDLDWVRRQLSDGTWVGLVSEENLSSAVLHWDPREAVLTCAYASGSSGNDRYIRLHMNDSHRKQDGLPTITGPHYGKIGAMASGEVGGKYRVWSGHTTDGNVYIENNGVLDKSKAYDGVNEEVRLDVTTGRLYSPSRDMFSVLSASLRHTGAAGKSVNVTVVTGRDDGGTDQTVSKTVSLNGNKGTEFFVGRAGEFAEFRITGGVRSDFALQEINIKSRIMSQAGTVKT